MLKVLLITICLTMLLSCGEETLTRTNQATVETSTELKSFELNTCSEMHFEKPPVDILYLVDNSGSTLASSFQAIKTEIQNTIYNISSEFDYHIYFAPLNSGASDSITAYPLILNNPDSIPSLASLNVVQASNLDMFAPASGNNTERGFERAQNIIKHNRSNGIFRNNANTIILMISNGDDTEAEKSVNGNTVPDSNVFSSRLLEFKKLTQRYYQGQTATPSDAMNAESLRFISLVAHSNCNGWKNNVNYKKMSNELYTFQELNDNTSFKDSYDLCASNYSGIFQAVNTSIRQVVVGHKYDHWKISSASESSIQENDITLTKIKSDGTTVEIPRDKENGFEYLGYQQNQATRYEPTVGEPASGLMVKLNGSAKVQYPECLIAKTRTPTEYFGYFSLPKAPDLTTLQVKIDGVVFEQNETDGWSYIGWRDVINVKVPGPTKASVTPALNKSGYMIQLHGKAIYTNGQKIEVFYKAAPK